MSNMNKSMVVWQSDDSGLFFASDVSWCEFDWTADISEAEDYTGCRHTSMKLISDALCAGEQTGRFRTVGVEYHLGQEYKV